MTSTPFSDPSRRLFLRGSLATAAFASFGQVFGAAGKPGFHALSSDPAAVLNLAATAEALSVTLYHQVLSRASFGLSAEARSQLQTLLEAEQSHLTLLGTLGGASLTRQFWFPEGLLSNAGLFADTALHLEEACRGAYIAACHQFARQGKADLAATAAQLGASEAQHLTTLSHLAGFGPGDLSLPAAPFRQVADVSPVLSPFVAHAAGRVSAALPTPAQVGEVAAV